MGAPSVTDEKPDERTGSAERDLVPPAERGNRQRMRSIAIAVALVVMAVLFYAATIVRLGGNALNRPM